MALKNLSIFLILLLCFVTIILCKSILFMEVKTRVYNSNCTEIYINGVLNSSPCLESELMKTNDNNINIDLSNSGIQMPIIHNITCRADLCNIEK